MKTGTARLRRKWHRPRWSLTVHARRLWNNGLDGSRAHLAEIRAALADAFNAGYAFAIREKRT